MITMIDNYDSFTYNLVQYLQELGADVVIYRNDEIEPEKVLAQAPKGIVLSPGPGRPHRAGIMPDLISRTAGTVPILGVCLGYQAIAEAFGGQIDYAPKLMHGKTSAVEHHGNGIFAGLASPVTVTRYHSLIVRRDTLPECFEVTAWTDDVLMGISHRSFPYEGVQFHPESILSADGKGMLQNWLETL